MSSVEVIMLAPIAKRFDSIPAVMLTVGYFNGPSPIEVPSGAFIAVGMSWIRVFVSLDRVDWKDSVAAVVLISFVGKEGPRCIAFRLAFA